MNLRSLLVGVSIILGSVAASSHRAVADDEATEQARKHYQEAQKQFDLGMWEAAISEFTKAYELRPDASFLFNMAQAYRRSGNARRAIDLYKNYLIKVPKSLQRAEVQERIESLQRQLDEEDRAAKRNAPTPLPPAPSLTPEPASPPGESLAPPPANAPPAEKTAAATAAATNEDVDSATVVPDESPAAATGQAAATAIATEPAPAAVAATPSTTTTAKAVPAQDRGSHPLLIAGLFTGAAGLAGIGAGIAFSVRTKSLSDSVSSAAQFNSGDAQAGRQAAVLQWVCYGAGGAAVLAGALLYGQGRAKKGKDTAVSFAPLLAPTTAGLLATGSL